MGRVNQVFAPKIQPLCLCAELRRAYFFYFSAARRRSRAARAGVKLGLKVSAVM